MRGSLYLRIEQDRKRVGAGRTPASSCAQLLLEVSEKNSSRKLADQARLPTLRHLIGMRVYECRFPRMSLLGDSVNKGNPAPRHWLSLIILASDSREADNKISRRIFLRVALREGQPRREAGERKA